MAKSVILRGKVFIKEATLSSGSGDDLLTIDSSTGEVGKISGTPLTTTLTAGSVFLGNVSNVATATALSGDVTINSSGVTAIGTGVIVNDDVNASAAIAHSKMAALTASRALVSDGSGVVSVSSVTSAQIGYLSTTTSDVQVQIDAKQATITGAATTITSSNLTASRALIANSSGKVAVSSVTDTELGYVSGVTSAIQTQLNTKLAATITSVAEGDILYYNGSAWVNLARGSTGEVLTATASTIEWGASTANGLTSGGTANQFLVKQSGTDYDAAWEDLVVADLTDLTATVTELNLLDGVTATTAEINYLDGVTSNIQSQFGNKLSNSLPHNAIFVGNISNQAASLSAGTEGQILTVSSGTPTWTTVSASGVTTIAALDGTTKSANGAAISGVNLYLQTADATYPGLVSTGTQTFAGAKTFNDSLGIGGAPSNKFHVKATVDGAFAQFEGGASGFSTILSHDANGAHFYTNSVARGFTWGANSSTSQMVLSSGGNLGIGVSPSFALDVSSASLGYARVTTSGTGEGGLILKRTGGTASEWQFLLPTGTDRLGIFGGGATRATISAAGNVGIGTTSPTAKIHLAAGTATANTAPIKLTTGTALTTPEDGALEYHSSHLYFTVSSTRYQLDGLIGSTGSTDNAILRANGTGGLTAQSTGITIDDSNYITVPSTGRIGVGGAPSYSVDVVDGINPTMACRTSGVGSPGLYLQRTGGTTSASYLYIPEGSDELIIQNNLTDRFFFANDKLGIGVSPTNKLDISDSSALVIRAVNTSTNSVGYRVQRTGGTTGLWDVYLPSGSSELRFYDGTADRFTFNTSGTGTAVDWVATSDRRTKENIHKVEGDVIEEIKQIGSLFSRYERSGKTERGFIAQELLEVAPEYVTVPEDPETQFYAINYAKMTALLFKGFQQLLDK